MVKSVAAIVVALGILSGQAGEPSRVVLTDVEKNIYVEDLHITNQDITPDCPVPWSIRKVVPHGGKQEGVEVIDVDNGKLRFRIVPTQGMSIQEARMGDIRLGWDSPVKGLVHPQYIDLHARAGLGWLEGFNEWMVRCDLEPGMGFPRNRAVERKFGRVPKLKPHQSRSFTIDSALHAGREYRTFPHFCDPPKICQFSLYAAVGGRYSELVNA